jgi:cyclin B
VRQLGKILQNKDVHCIGVTSMYLASKYEDIFPLHSKIVSEKIAHKAIPAKDILRKEQEFLKAFDFQIDFVTHYDFHQTYCDKIERLAGASK